MYVRIAFSIELRLRVSRSLRSLANKVKGIKIHFYKQVVRTFSEHSYFERVTIHILYNTKNVFKNVHE